MSSGLIGRKLGMTQVFGDGGKMEPVTVIQAGPCVVVQKKTRERDGYDALQLGLVEGKPDRKANKPKRGHFAKADVPPTRVVREFRSEEASEGKPGDGVTCQIFKAGELVDIVGKSKGRGFQGVMKRHGHSGGRASHGSMFHRAPGSIGQSAYPSKVFKGIKMPGQMGTHRISAKGLVVVEVDSERNLLVVRGSVPGSRGSLVTIHRRSGAADGE